MAGARNIGRAAAQFASGNAAAFGTRGGGRSGASAASSAAASLSVGSDSMTFKNTFSGSSALVSNSMSVVSGSVVFAVVGMGLLANVHAPTDSAGNAYSALLPGHNYQNWSGSGQRLYAATGVTGGGSVVLTETMPDTDDEVTLSVLEVRGGTSITNAVAAETATTGPVTSASVTTSGSAILACWWWGDGAVVQAAATPSVGWTKTHELAFAQASGGVLQVCLAVKSVSAGSHSCTWTTADGQGAVTYIVSVE